jgi:hypothetical protein
MARKTHDHIGSHQVDPHLIGPMDMKSRRRNERKETSRWFKLAQTYAWLINEPTFLVYTVSNLYKAKKACT